MAMGRLFVLVAFATAGCGDGTTGPKTHLDRIEIVQGDGQSGVEGEPLGDSIVAHAVRSDGVRDLNAVVVARIASGDGGLRAPGVSASGTGAGVGGRGDGTIRVQWTLGPADGEQALLIYAVEFGDSVAANVTATAVAADGR